VRIFVSHNAKDKDTARLLAGRLAERGIDVWFDQWEIGPGESIIGGIDKGITDCQIFVLMWSAHAKASKWVDTELRAALRKRVDNESFKLVPIMLDDSALPTLVAEYRGFVLGNIGDLESIATELASAANPVEGASSLQARFLELVAKQFPETDEVRSLICPRCGSRNLSAQVKHEPQFDERLYLVRCADCGWEQQAKGDSTRVRIRPFKADLGATTATGFVFVADPIEDSIIRGTLNVLGLENVSFEARVPGPPLRITVLNVTVVISFDPVLRAFTVTATQAGDASLAPTTIIGLG
jgi:hypothetical protein